MNTAVQDAHNLAWKLATATAWRKSASASARASTNTSTSTTGSAHLDMDMDTDMDALAQGLLYSYHTERRPVAENNMALSERNFSRTAAVAELLGGHPQYESSFVYKKCLRHNGLLVRTTDPQACLPKHRTLSRGYLTAPLFSPLSSRSLPKPRCLTW